MYLISSHKTAVKFCLVLIFLTNYYIKLDIYRFMEVYNFVIEKVKILLSLYDKNKSRYLVGNDV